jgi:hypothetical protein
MTKTLAALVLMGGLPLASMPALAADPPIGRQPTVEMQKERLEKRSTEIARRYSGTKLGAVQQAEIARQQRAIKEMIRRLEAGEEVSPGEVDRILRGR